MDLTLGERQGGPRLRDALPRLVDRVGAVTELRLRLLDLALRFRIDAARRLVQNQNPRIGEECVRPPTER